ncbi:MAG: ABC transporter ATP-binding protein [Candidatus Thorarchaeota archaeon]|nr:MAG: ABC transporter ATP-binding protein [Candidatus Thorarchaeota archaeon]
MTCAIEINNLYFSYSEFSLQDVNMNLHLGEQKALVGLNGSGKTTLFKLILGLLEPRSGSIHVFERTVDRENLWEIRKEVGFLFQNPDDQLFAPTVWEDVAFGPRNLGMADDEVEQRVNWSLDVVGMSDFFNRSVNQMSHGQAKRVALAGIIAMRPKILLLDEPFAGLDFPMVSTMVDIIHNLRNEGISVLYTTHNRFFLENWADSIAVLHEGRVIYDGPTEHALADSSINQQTGNWDELGQRMRRYRGLV